MSFLCWDVRSHVEGFIFISAERCSTEKYSLFSHFLPPLRPVVRLTFAPLEIRARTEKPVAVNRVEQKQTYGQHHAGRCVGVVDDGVVVDELAYLQFLHSK